MPFELDPSYKDVPARIADFKAKHPDGSLQPYDPARPFEIVTVGDRTFIAYTAAAYRSPEDPRPGIGVAWEPWPGRTPYTKDSELQNAETSAWGRAIVAALASESKTIASAEDVRNRQAEREVLPPDELVEARQALAKRVRDELSIAQDEEFKAWLASEGLPKRSRDMTLEQVDACQAWLDGLFKTDARPASNPGASLHELTDDEREMALVGAMKPAALKDALRQRGLLDEDESDKVQRNRLLMALRSERASA